MNKHGITKENLLATLPPALQADPSVAALADAIAGVLADQRAEIDQLLIYPAIETLDEPLLDILAHDFKVDWWDPEYTLEEKRRTLKNSWRVHKTLGTKQAVITAVSSVYAGAEVQEWWEYGGKPYHFRLRIQAGDEQIELERSRRLLDRISFYKNVRSVLESAGYQIGPLSIPDQLEQLALQKMHTVFSISNYPNIILLNHHRTLDGTWRLDQAFRGLGDVCFRIVAVIVEQKQNQLSSLLIFCMAAQHQSLLSLDILSLHIQFLNQLSSNTIQLNGSKKLNGDWQLDQHIFRSPAFPTFQIASAIPNRSGVINVTLTQQNMWQLNGRKQLDGNRKLNASINKEKV